MSEHFPKYLQALRFVPDSAMWHAGEVCLALEQCSIGFREEKIVVALQLLQLAVEPWSRPEKRAQRSFDGDPNAKISVGIPPRPHCAANVLEGEADLLCEVIQLHAARPHRGGDGDGFR